MVASSVALGMADDTKVSAPTLPGRDVLIGHAFVLCTIFFLSPVYWAYKMAIATPSFKTDACVAVIVAGVGATACLVGAMVFLDRRLEGGAAHAWYIRVGLEIEKRIIVLLQLATMSLALAAGAVLVLGLPLPILR
jgi:hypothetical protein